MGDNLRASMMYPTPPKSYFLFMNAVLMTRRFVLRYLTLPRPEFMRVQQISDELDTKTGRYHPLTYLAHPFYVQPGFLNRWGLEGWFVWSFGGDVSPISRSTSLRMTCESFLLPRIFFGV